MSVTLRDIGKRLSLSHSTVSRALRNDPQISEATRLRVQQTAAQMGYRVNHMARALVSRKVQSIALVIPDVVDPFYARIIEGVDQVAHSRGYALLLYVTHSDPKREDAAVEEAAMHRYGGTILFRRHLPTSHLRKVLKDGTPIVLLTQYEPGLGVDSIRVDDVDGGYKATDYLINLGHKRIACLTGLLDQHETRDRLLGFHEAHQRAGLTADPDLIWEGDFQEKAGIRAARRYLKIPPPQRPTALFAFNDRMAIGFLQEAQALGIKVPDDVSVVGYDDIEPCRYTTPTLTTISQPTRDMGARAAEILIRRLEGEIFSTQEMLLKTELVVRDSAAPR